MKIPIALLVCVVGLLCLAQAAPAPSYESSPDFQKARAEARQQERAPNTIYFAVGSWKKANKLAGGHCMECLQGVFETEMRMGQYKDALKAAREWDEAAQQPVDHARAELADGRAAIAVSDHNKPNMAALEEAHAELQKVEAMNAPAAFFYDGQVLALMKQDADAGKAFAETRSKNRAHVLTRDVLRRTPRDGTRAYGTGSGGQHTQRQAFQPG